MDCQTHVYLCSKCQNSLTSCQIRHVSYVNYKHFNLKPAVLAAGEEETAEEESNKPAAVGWYVRHMCTLVQHVRMVFKSSLCNTCSQLCYVSFVSFVRYDKDCYQRTYSSDISKQEAAAKDSAAAGLEAQDACSVCQKTSTKGSDYKGQANQTKSGLSCQMWSETSPHKHKHTGLPRNFCR